jgi:transketolase
MNLKPFTDKWKSFGFIVYEVNGHSFPELCDAIDKALANKTDKPVCIIAKTIKGCGIDFMEDNYKWHYGAIDGEKYAQAQASLKKFAEKRLEAVK